MLSASTGKKTWIKKISTFYMKVTEGAGIKLSKSLDYYVASVKVLPKFVHGLIKKLSDSSMSSLGYPITLGYVFWAPQMT